MGLHAFPFARGRELARGPGGKIIVMLSSMTGPSTPSFRPDGGSMSHASLVLKVAAPLTSFLVCAHCFPSDVMSPLLASPAAATRSAPEPDRYRCMLGKAHLIGTIREYDGRLLPGATIVYYGLKWNEDCRGGVWEFFRAVTDTNGHYELTVPEGVGSLSVEYSVAPGRSRRSLLRQESLHTGEVRTDYQFERWHVDGHVVGPDGSPIRSGTVTYYVPAPGMCGTGLPEVTFRNGKFDIFLDHRGTYCFWTQALPRIPGIPTRGPRIEIRGDTTITIRLGEHLVEGTVRNREGGVLPNAQVLASGFGGSAFAQTDSTGHYRLFLSSGSYNWSIEAPQYHTPRWASQDTTDVQSSRHVDLQIRTVEWSGVVRDATSGAYLDSIRIFPQGAGTCLSGPKGTFRLITSRGVPVDLELWDARLEGIPRKVSADPAEWERQEALYSRVKRHYVRRVASLADSTFDILMEPVPK